MKSFGVLLTVSMLFSILYFSGCNQPGNNPVEVNNNNNSDSFLAKHYNLPSTTMAELQQAKIATARYNNLANAIADGYVDINVIVPHMGYHYMKSGYVNGTFEIDKPEILVYSRNQTNGQMKLVAVEYAVPNTFPEPSGFTGDYDVWDNNPTFGLWLLHAWVWEYNPDGVFTDLNPNVE